MTVLPPGETYAMNVVLHASATVASTAVASAALAMLIDTRLSFHLGVIINY